MNDDPQRPRQALSEPAFLRAAGEMPARIREVDWSKTPLGTIATWPQSLRTALSICLASRFPMILWWGPELCILYNDAYVPILAKKHPDVLGATGRDAWGEVWGVIGPMLDGVMRESQASWSDDQLLLMGRKGFVEEAYFTWSYSPISDESGAVGGVFTAVTETTSRVLAARRLRLLRELADDASQATEATEACKVALKTVGQYPADVPFCWMYLTSGDRLELACSAGPTSTGHPEVIALHDEGPLAQVARTGEALVLDDVGARFGELVGSSWPQPIARAFVLPIMRAGEDRPWGAIIAGSSPRLELDDDYKAFLGLMAGQIATAVNTARAREEERRRAAQLAEIDRAKTAFFSNVSHEFRTPLTLMLGPTEDALSSPERALRGPELEAVYRNELRLLKLVNTLLDFARIEAGRSETSYEPTDLSALTTDLASSFRSAMERAGLLFEVDCPPLVEPVYVDHDKWEKIVLNLISNALKFTFEGKVRVRLRALEGDVELTVLDTGVGIAERELPRLFDRFHRIEGTRARTHEGSGIGLALVQELARMHGGSVDVTSKLGAGTTFSVRVPKGTAHLPKDGIGAPRTLSTTSAGAAYVEEALRWLPAATSGSPSSRPSAAETDTRKTRILVADDNADMRDYVARILRHHWTVVDTVADGVEALEKARQDRPDLVVSDVMMPRLDGFGLIRELRSDRETASIPIVLLSARAGEEAIADAIRSGADDYLVKPFSASVLVARVEAQLSAARLRKALHQHEEDERLRMKLLIDEAPAAIAVMRGHDLVIEMVNPLCLEVWGRKDASELLGRPMVDALPEFRQQLEYVALLRGVITTGKAYRAIEAPVRMDREGSGAGKTYYFTLTYAPLREPDGSVDGVFVYAFDVTEQVLARRRIEELRATAEDAFREAEAANRLKDEFLATMSHELRTPLHAILGWTKLLRGGDYDPKGIDRGLATIERNARSQARLIEDVLDVSRIIIGKLRLDMRRLDLNAIALAALDVVRPAADAKRLRLAVDLRAEDAFNVIGDADRVQQVIWNLLSNAVKFTPPDGTVFLTVERVESSACIVVRDTGPGIQSEHLPYIFERFRQGDSATTRKHGGLGLGLAIVRHLVDLHGGSVSAESGGPGLGATFTVRLRIRAVHDAIADGEQEPKADGAVAMASRQETRSLRSLAGAKILVVEDEEDSRLLIEEALVRAGAAVTSVDSARAGLAHLEKHRVDVLISDIGMPEEDGFMLMRRIRALPASRGGNVPAIALTAYARTDDALRTLEAGYQRHLAKPADFDVLIHNVASMLEDRS